MTGEASGSSGVDVESAGGDSKQEDQTHGDARLSDHDEDRDQTEVAGHALSTAELLGRLEKQQSEYEAKYLAAAKAPDYADRLVVVGKRLLEDPIEFKPGDLVMWKPGMKNKLLPDYEKPAFVVDASVHLSPDTETDEIEPKNLLLGIITGEELFRVFAFDKRRFTYWTETNE